MKFGGGNESPNQPHHNPEGYRRVAEVIYENLMDHDLIPS